MRSLLPVTLLAVLCLLGSALAQQRHNSLAIDEKLRDDAGPYYFIEYGDSSNAFARSAQLAQAMGLELDYSNDTKTLTFRRDGITARIKATSDVHAGLVKRAGVLDADGNDIESPMAIIVDGVSYVPIVPIAKAFGCDFAWHGQYRLITVNTPRPQRTTAQPQITRPPLQAVVASNSRPAGTAEISGFRVGVHEGFTRVAVDLGELRDYSLAAGERVMAISFAVSSASGRPWEERDDNLVSVSYGELEGRPALFIRTRHGLDPAGKGFRFGRTESNTLYIDFGPELSGKPVSALEADSDAGDILAMAPVVAAVPALPLPPAQEGRPVVVIDAGHGGKFPGARNGSWREEEIVLSVALKAKTLLEASGIDVVLTRDGDTHLSSDYRKDLSARAAFATPERNLFVSIHANSVTNRNAEGIETYVFGQPLDQRSIERAIEENGGGDQSLGQAITAESISVANETSGIILRETQLNYSRRLARSVQTHLVRATGAVDRGVKQSAFYVIQNARTPAILVEIGFVSNPVEGRKLASSDYQATLARSLVAGILEFLETGGTLASH